MRRHIAVITVCSALLAFSSGAFACPECEEGGTFSEQVGVTITGTSSSFATATGQYNEAHASGYTAGDGAFSKPNVNVSGEFESGFEANAGKDDWGTVAAQGAALGGVLFGVAGDWGKRAFAGRDVEKSEALASGGGNDTYTWNDGLLEGSAWLDAGSKHVESDASSQHQAEDSWSTDSHSEGAGEIAGTIGIEFNHDWLSGVH